MPTKHKAKAVAKKKAAKRKITKKKPAKRLSLSARLKMYAGKRKTHYIPEAKAGKAKPKAKPVFRITPQKIHPDLLHRHHGNPIIEPRPHLTWESKATLNPGAVEVGGKVHLLYRAIGDEDISVVGHAVSYDGLHIDARFDEPAYIPDMPKRKGPLELQRRIVGGAYLSGGGGWGGSEDPRATIVDDTLFLTYTAFDGWGSVRVALASISVEDFLADRMLWDGPAYLSPPGEVHKNWVLFPEKINGKYAVLHSISPDILINYIDDFDGFMAGERSITSHYDKKSRTGNWDSWVRGIGPPPIKTKYGWLLLYHAMDVRDPNRYKLGAMLVDLNDPTKILHRSQEPVLEPEEWYENTGWKSGVVYACGAIVKDGTLFVYYGGADSVVCVATASLTEFLEHLMNEGAAKLVPGPKAKPIKAF